ncbi:unnamed protein product, partial [Meganyctiphanes norvegica]
MQVPSLKIFNERNQTICLGYNSASITIMRQHRHGVTGGRRKLLYLLNTIDTNFQVTLLKKVGNQFEKTPQYNRRYEKLASLTKISQRYLYNFGPKEKRSFAQKRLNSKYQKSDSYFFERSSDEKKKMYPNPHPKKVPIKQKLCYQHYNECKKLFHELYNATSQKFLALLYNMVGPSTVHMHIRVVMVIFEIKFQKSILDLGGTCWVSKEQFEKIILEQVKDHHYAFFIKSIERLVDHPNASRVKEFIMPYRRKMATQGADEEIPKLLYTEDGIPYMTHEGRRKTANAKVTVYGEGSGNITINGRNILYFTNIQDREQVLFPLQFSKLLGKVDVVAEVEGGGMSGQSGSIRYGIAMCCRSFLDREMIEDMRLAGLLMYDLRRRERKKPGQKGPRAKFTWKKR